LSVRGVSAGLQRAHEHLTTHLAGKVTLAELATVSGLSRSHLVRCFARAYGLPPHAYHTVLRVRDVEAQLRAGRRLAEIEAGFADQSHLIRRFKRVTGVTPGEYLRRVRRANAG